MPTLSDRISVAYDLVQQVERGLNVTRPNQQVLNSIAVREYDETADRFTVEPLNAAAHARLRASNEALVAERARSLEDLRGQVTEELAGMPLEELNELIIQYAPTSTVQLSGDAPGAADPNSTAEFLRVLRATRTELEHMSSEVQRAAQSRFGRLELFSMFDEFLTDESAVGQAKVDMFRTALAAARDNTQVNEEDNPLLFMMVEFFNNLMATRR